MCVYVGRLVCRGWDPAAGGKRAVNGIESQARVVLRSLYVVVVNGNETLDRRWKCVSEGLMADGSFGKGGETVQVLVKDESVDMEVCEDSHQSMWWLKGVHFGPKRLVCRKVGSSWLCGLRGCTGSWLRRHRVRGIVCL